MIIDRRTSGAAPVVPGPVACWKAATAATFEEVDSAWMPSPTENASIAEVVGSELFVLVKLAKLTSCRDE